MIEIRDNQTCLQQIVEAFDLIKKAGELLTEAVKIDMDQLKPEGRLHILGVVQLKEELKDLRKTYESDVLEIDNAQCEMEPELICPICGKTENPPFAEGDECICGGLFHRKYVEERGA